MVKVGAVQADALKNNIDAIVKWSEATLTGVERLSALNLAVARSLVEESVALTQSYAKVGDVEQLAALTAPLGEKASGQWMKYMQDVQAVSKDLQSTYTRLMSEQVNLLGDNAATMAPMLDAFRTATQQVSEMTAAGVRAATEITGKLSESMERKGRKTA